ncbi:hypothetical protein SAMN02745248_01180 [Hathewaya proteolytica DSM 3090]|uniref:Uncharacterized protein n=1 Tax=Hathewaya proteolytica DSM 3090 TaxID=1121331 RepID=A0A1M6MUU7_9CLOT|nr:hypothetical protein [Hathewaya proteolytica]SHJ87196.1 hypothetical protein SAMN02745248_01180 [Hathewaya proteolytica DSM 3090]
MAVIKKDGRSVQIELGCKKCKVKSYEPNGRKIIKQQVFNQGYVTFELEDGTLVEQYVLITPWNRYLFYKLIKAIKGEFNINDECENFQYEELIGKEVVIELEDEHKDTGTYTNITNIYNVEDGEILIIDDNKRKEKRFSEMEKNNLINMQYMTNKVNENINYIDTGIEDMENEEINF